MGRVYKIYGLKYVAETGLIKAGAKQPEELYNFASQRDGDPDIVLDLSEESEINLAKEKALEWLKEKKNTCEPIQSFAGRFYRVTAYDVEMITEDDDGEYLDTEILAVAEDK